ncbi:hypothetical protein V8E54_004458 [Elaphomyces granulatus]
MTDRPLPSNAHLTTSKQDAAHLRRPQSLPPRSTSAPGHRSANHVSVHPASSEVISSLISSLESISTPARSHFENVPHIGSYTAPPSPRVPPSEFSQPRGRSNRKPSIENGDYGPHKTSSDTTDSPFLHPDDAAIAPVIRMGPAPASPRSRNSSRRSSSTRRPSSKSSYTSLRTRYEDSTSISAISAEPGRRFSTAASIASSSSGGRKSLQLGLFKRSSREFPPEKEVDHLRKSTNYGDGLKLRVSHSKASLRSRRSMANLVEEGGPNSAVVEFKNNEEEKSSLDVKRAPSQRSLNGPIPSPGGIGNGRFIPTRESSLRHSMSGSSNTKRKSARHSRYSSTGSKDLKIEVGIAEVNTETTTKRIKELKEQQKRIRTEIKDSEEMSANSQHAVPEPQPQLPQTSSEQPNRLSRNVEGPPRDIGRVDDLHEESAPSPAIQTRRARESKRNSGPLVSKTVNIQPLIRRQSLEKSDQLSRAYSRRSSEPMSPLSPRHHKRTPSSILSQGRQSTAEEQPSSLDSIDIAVEAYVSSSRLTQKVPHPRSGRMIAFSEVGDPKGHVVFCCLGMGLTRFLMAFYDELARTLKLRLVTLDRPGVGESEPCLDGSATPLSWPDDIAIVCNFLKITKFSILAHSAGAIYALATALRMSQHIRGRIHLLAPWIPPSQMSNIGSHKEPLPNTAVPYTLRILRALPTPILRVANSSLMTATSSSITTSLPKSPRRSKRKSTGKDTPAPGVTEFPFTVAVSQSDHPRMTPSSRDHGNLQDVESSTLSSLANGKSHAASITRNEMSVTQNRERQTEYDNRLTFRIWELATTNANPAVDLLVCLERRQTIGFRYVDITRTVVIHHGSRDTRVPVDNIRWLGKTMRRCEVRVLEGEGHGLMASAVVMSNVLTEIAKEWEDWTTVVQGRREVRRLTITHSSRKDIVV